jgi:hypothetical protein
MKTILLVFLGDYVLPPDLLLLIHLNTSLF